MTTQPHPELSEEASSLPVVAHMVEKGRIFVDQPVLEEDEAERAAFKRQDGAIVSPLVRLSDAQSQLNAMRAERDAARVLAASHSNECEKWAAMHQRSKAEISDLKTDYESRLKKLCDHGMGLCDQIDALKAALKAAPVVDVERIMALAEAYADEVNKYLTCEPNDQVAAREALRAALACPEGSPR